MRKTFKIKKQNRGFIVVFVFLCCLILLYYFNRQISPALADYAELEVKKISSVIINKAVSDNLTSGIEINDLFIMTKNDDGEVVTVDFNPLIMNRVLTKTTGAVLESFRQLEEGVVDATLSSSSKKGVVVEITSGQILGNFLFNNLGPKIPVRFKLVGDIQSNIETKVTNYGINNALIEVFLNIKVNGKVLLPVTSSLVSQEVNVPIAMKILKGNVPSYYAGGLSKQSAVFSLPVE